MLQRPSGPGGQTVMSPLVISASRSKDTQLTQIGGLVVDSHLRTGTRLSHLPHSGGHGTAGYKSWPDVRYYAHSNVRKPFIASGFWWKLTDNVNDFGYHLQLHGYGILLLCVPEAMPECRISVERVPLACMGHVN